MKDAVNPPKNISKPRGRPRSEKAKSAILKAARKLLAEGGPGAVTMEAIAANSGVGKPTIYRWWPDRHAVAMAALMEEEDSEKADTEKQPASLHALKNQLRAIAKRFSTRTGRHIASMIAASDTESELSKAFRNHFVMAHRSEGKVFIEQAVKSGELRRNIDIEVALDLLYGPLFFRLIMGHSKLDESFTDAVFEHAMAGIKGLFK